ncbi:hypothetical protein [Pontibacter beigongshangensis]|uniref:hypothetical protein n=1 Tax=Pontibacter beigongshangensis TaxID=2574733 RepID=UPI00164FEBFC|nr:hypothetical protein [Pontibacter beigongshangensis]
MESDNIVKVEIDTEGKLHIKPESVKFPMIYTTATEVHWDTVKQTLFSPIPGNWTYLEWFSHIIEVVREECFYRLNLTDKTEWCNVPAALIEQFKKVEEKQR